MTMFPVISNEVAEERLLTDEIKTKYEVELIELETTINMEDYMARKLSLIGIVSPVKL